MPATNRILPLLTGLLSVGGLLWMAILLGRVWFEPLSVEGGHFVSIGVGIMVMEFILVHSGAMVAGASMMTEHRWKILAVLALFYTLFGVTIALAFESRMLLFSFLLIMVPRFANATSGTEEVRTFNFVRSMISAALYLAVAFMSVLVEFPAGGLTPEVLNEFYPDRGDGIWEKAPQQALAMGVVYFTVLAVVELFATRRTLRAMSGGTTAAA